MIYDLIYGIGLIKLSRSVESQVVSSLSGLREVSRTTFTGKGASALVTLLETTHVRRRTALDAALQTRAAVRVTAKADTVQKVSSYPPFDRR